MRCDKQRVAYVIRFAKNPAYQGPDAWLNTPEPLPSYTTKFEEAYAFTDLELAANVSWQLRHDTVLDTKLRWLEPRVWSVLLRDDAGTPHALLGEVGKP